MQKCGVLRLVERGIVQEPNQRCVLPKRHILPSANPRDSSWVSVLGCSRLFWELRRCSENDVSAAQNSGRKLLDGGSTERFHFRAEQADLEDLLIGHELWDRYSVAPPHFDDDCTLFGGISMGHFVPPVFPHPDYFGPGWFGSGFDAGRDWLVREFVTTGGHELVAVEYWGNVAAILQPCDAGAAYSDGIVSFIRL